MTGLRYFLLLLVSVVTGSAQSLFGEALYSVSDLGTLGGTRSLAYGINNSGQVVGWAYTSDNLGHAFLYGGSGPMRDLGTLGGNGSTAFAINDGGQVVGSAKFSSDNISHAFLYTGSGPMQDLGTLGGVGSAAYGINKSGQVVGWAGTSDGFGHAFLSSSGGPMKDLGTLGGHGSGASAINESGQVVGGADIEGGGGHAFLYTGSGPMEDLGLLRGWNTGASDINDGGQIVGEAHESGQARAFLKSGSNPMLDLGDLGATPGGSGQPRSTAYAINNSGQVVGASDAPSAWHAFVYSGNGPMQDLNDLIDPASGWTLEEATDINDRSQIVGYGTNPSGEMHGFLLTPVPEPSALAMLLAGGIAVGAWIWRGRRKGHWAELASAEKKTALSEKTALVDQKSPRMSRLDFNNGLFSTPLCSERPPGDQFGIKKPRETRMSWLLAASDFFGKQKKRGHH